MRSVDLPVLRESVRSDARSRSQTRLRVMRFLTFLFHQAAVHTTTINDNKLEQHLSYFRCHSNRKVRAGENSFYTQAGYQHITNRNTVDP